MKKFLTVLTTLLFTITAFGFQEPIGELETSFSAIKSLFLPAIVGQALILLADARKHYWSKDWSWGIFFKTKIKPFLITTLGGVVIYLLISHLPFTKQFIEVLADSDLTEVTAGAFFGLASGIVDGFLKKPDNKK